MITALATKTSAKALYLKKERHLQTYEKNLISHRALCQPIPLDIN